MVWQTGEEVRIPLERYAAERPMEPTEVEELTLDQAHEEYREVVAEMDERQAANFFASNSIASQSSRSRRVSACKVENS